jgi:hypothetical protein
METKIRLRIGTNEFEASGSAEEIKEAFEKWTSLLERYGDTNLPEHIRQASGGVKPSAELSAAADTNGLSSLPIDRLRKLFDVDEARRLVTLRSLPVSESGRPDALVLVCYGLRRLFEQEEAPVTGLTAALQMSGMTPGRIDRVAGPLLREGILLKRGRGKGGRYRLTNRGLARAEQLVEELLAQLI